MQLTASHLFWNMKGQFPVIVIHSQTVQKRETSFELWRRRSVTKMSADGLRVFVAFVNHETTVQLWKVVWSIKFTSLQFVAAWPQNVDPSPGVISVPDSSSVAFAFSGWWKIQTIQILLPRSAVGRRKRKTRTETGEKINLMRAETVLTTKERSNRFLFLLSAAQRVPPHLLNKRRRNPKRRKRNGIPSLESHLSSDFIFSSWQWLLTRKFCVSVRHQKTRKKTGRCF